MENEIKGYRLETCFSSAGCPNQAVNSHDLIQQIEKQLSKRNLKSFLKERVKGPLKIHHEFVVSVSDCPNACSRPQIVDIGLIGSRKPEVSEESCSHCRACVEICQEKALMISIEDNSPNIDFNHCLSCGQCLKVCPTGTLYGSALGYRILVGGKLGRHPQLGKELPGIYSIEDTLKTVGWYLDYYQRHNREGERLGEIINREKMEISDKKESIR